MASPESEKLFRDGQALLAAGKLSEACDAFERSRELVVSPGTLLNLARCREQQGKTATAWKLFVEAEQLAATRKRPDVRLEAEKRANAIKANLSYITITVAPERQVEGLAIKRNGLAVDPAMWNTPVALDPGDYVVEASAPRYKPWSSTSQRLGTTDKLTVVVDALQLDQVEPPPHETREVVGPAIVKPAERPDITPPIGDVARTAPKPSVWPLAVGLLVGGRRGAPDPEASENKVDQDALFGARISGGIPARHGAARAIASFLTYREFLDNPRNNCGKTHSYAFELSANYVWMPRPQVGFSAGLGGGVDVLARNENRGTDFQGFWTLHASPIIVRVLEGRMEVGLHVEYARADRGVSIALLAVDLFPL